MSSFKEKVIYQIYPRSFKDSNGDGIGDLPGIIEKIPYLKKLGVDMIWLSPIYPSPQNDNGYDVADYFDIDPVFGTMSDFEALMKQARENDIDVMLDMVFNHTSTEHQWFQNALAGEKKYQDYYLLKPAKADGSLPTNWDSKFGGVAWEKFDETDLYYLHLYDVTQADLNWRNTEVRKKMAEVVNFWLEKGVHGFRFDVINVIGKDAELVDSVAGNEKSLYTDKPIVHEYIHELNQASFGQDENCVTVGEMSATSIENCLLYSQPERQELSMAFNFHHLKVDYENGEKWSTAPFNFQELKDLFNEWGEQMARGDGWNALFWNNHDQPRAVSRFTDDQEYRVAGAKMLAATVHLSRGTPFIYQGEEIGMTNPNFALIEEYKDIETLNFYQELREKGLAHAEIMAIIRSKSRDNSRTPVQWDQSENAGFTTGTPWLKVADNYLEINVKKELASGSIFAFYQKLIQLRKDYPVIAQGNYQRYKDQHEQVYAYLREYQEEQLLVLNNFYGKETQIEIPTEFVSGTVLISNYPQQKVGAQLILRPYETLALYVGDTKI